MQITDRQRTVASLEHSFGITTDLAEMLYDGEIIDGFALEVAADRQRSVASLKYHYGLATDLAEKLYDGEIKQFSREVADSLAAEILVAKLSRIVDRNRELNLVGEALASRSRSANRSAETASEKTDPRKDRA
jgi:hypothetical protein